MSDIVSIASTNEVGFLQNCSCYRQLGLYPSDEVESAFFIRVSVADRAGVLALIASAFGEHGVSIASMIQKGRGDEAELVLITHPTKEKQFFAAVRAGQESGVLPERTHDAEGPLRQKGCRTRGSGCRR